MSVRGAAKKCGLSESQIYQRLRNEDFKARYDAARQEVLTQAINAAQTATLSAIGTMTMIMSNPEISPQTRLNAADALIRNHIKLTEQGEILERLERLEEMEEKLEKHQ